MIVGEVQQDLVALQAILLADALGDGFGDGCGEADQIHRDDDRSMS